MIEIFLRRLTNRVDVIDSWKTRQFFSRRFIWSVCVRTKWKVLLRENMLITWCQALIEMGLFLSFCKNTKCLSSEWLLLGDFKAADVSLFSLFHPWFLVIWVQTGLARDVWHQWDRPQPQSIKHVCRFWATLPLTHVANSQWKQAAGTQWMVSEEVDKMTSLCMDTLNTFALN